MQRSPIVIARTISDAVATLAFDAGPVVVLPSSLAVDDAFAALTAETMRQIGSNHIAVVTPVAWKGRLRSLVDRGTSEWRTVDLQDIDPSCQLRSVVLPIELAEAGAVVVACDLDRVAIRGPYVLDVAASYVSPATRMRLHASRERVAAAAEINLAIRVRGSILALTIGGERWYLAAPDAIAGELAALTLAEHERGADRAVVGPWEDPIVQRATELQLGVPLPAGLAVTLAPGIDDSPVSQAIASLLGLRLGIT